MKAIVVRTAIGALLTLVAADTLAHGFGQRYDLPLPLWLWVVGAAATVVVTFVVAVLFVRPGSVNDEYPHVNLLGWRFARALASPPVTTLIRLFGVVAFVATIGAGLLGTEDPYRNLAPTMIWVVWWVGLAFVCALAGNLWLLLNPIRTLFCWAESAHTQLSGGRRLSLQRPYPAGLDAWPAVVFMFLFGWAELVWLDGDVPFALAMAALCYAILSWVGMFYYGRETWLCNAEAFSIAFGIFGRFAPIAYRSVDDKTAGAAPAGADASGHIAGRPELNLRPPAIGLISGGTVSVALMSFVILMLATVTYDGLIETPQFLDLLNALLNAPYLSGLFWVLRDLGLSEFQVLLTSLMLLLPVLFVIIYLLCCRLVVHLTSRLNAESRSSHTDSVTAVACAFVFTLVPIAIAYHLAHYLGMLLISGQYLIPLLSDPLGLGWDLFGSAGYEVDIGVISAKFVWYTAVVAIVLGHVLSVYIAHLTAIRRYGDGRTALCSQVPMIALMVLYTSLSLWILAQPIAG